MAKEKTNGHKETENMEVKLVNKGTVNKNEVYLIIGNRKLTLSFSYETIISFVYNDPVNYIEGTVENRWSTTTGKYLNELCPDKSKRLGEEKFKQQLAKALSLFGGASK